MRRMRLPKNSRFTRLHGATALVLALGFLAAGCGDDDDDSAKTAQDTQASLDGLAGFGQDALSSPGAQVLTSPAASDILASLPISLPGFFSGARTAPLTTSSVLPPVVPLTFSMFRPHEARPQALGGFGTYTYDEASTGGPFPGWVLLTANDPEDGYIFRFTESDGFGYVDPEDSSTVALQGEIRVLGIVLDEGDPETDEDDVLLHSVFEIAAGNYDGVPTDPDLYPVLVHVAGDVTLDENREPTRIRVGDRTANGSSDPDAAFIGDLLLSLEVDVTRLGDLADVSLLLQLYDSLDDYVVRVTTAVNDLNEATEAAEAITLGLGYGETTTPASPPWLYVTTLDNFRPDPTDPVDVLDEVADVSGTIKFNGELVANISGTTDEVDFDDDGTDDCINTFVFFESHPGQPVSICVLAAALLEAFGEFLPTAVSQAVQ